MRSDGGLTQAHRALHDTDLANQSRPRAVVAHDADLRRVGTHENVSPRKAALRYSVARTTRAQEHLGVLCQQRVVVLLAGPVPLLLLRDPRQANARRHAHARQGLADSLP
jgi:hypothetical protein